MRSRNFLIKIAHQYPQTREGILPFIRKSARGFSEDLDVLGAAISGNLLEESSFWDTEESLDNLKGELDIAETEIKQLQEHLRKGAKFKYDREGNLVLVGKKGLPVYPNIEAQPSPESRFEDDAGDYHGAAKSELESLSQKKARVQKLGQDFQKTWTKYDSWVGGKIGPLAKSFAELDRRFKSLEGAANSLYSSKNIEK